MISADYIEDGQLPLELNFKALKAKGLSYIQAHGSTQWTNLNPSDPGITILEQLCYAFTELGYCNNFDIKDILTTTEGELKIDNQFYLPETILTTAPITINDYIKLIIDKVVGITNVTVATISNDVIKNGCYTIHLAIDTNFNNPTVTNNPFLDTYFLLNSCRTIGEVFSFPKPLKPKHYTIQGTLEVKNGYDVHTVITNITQSVNAYVFPKPTASGYDNLKAEGLTTNEIFNGPKLQNGWIPSKSIQPKKDNIQTFEITKIIQSVEGVSSITNIDFINQQGEKLTIAKSETNELLVFDFINATQASGDKERQLQVLAKGKSFNQNINTSLVNELVEMQPLDAQIDTVTAVKMTPDLPTGTYRNITDYYSIQNTFPEIYTVGKDAVNDNTPTYKAAQSKQLKGYLTLFDQVLANQFAQLANIDKVFSFKNTTIGDVMDATAVYNKKDATEKKHPEYPAPFASFSPTYFYQSLYESVPNIRPLLKNNSIFDFGPFYKTKDQINSKAWELYKDDPYNSYMYGLMTIMQDETENIKRRNTILNHLLARHGESPLLIDSIIYDNVYSGDYDKDEVIIKSIYLENLGALSYNRIKGYDFFSATKLPIKLPKVTEEDQQKLKQGYLKDFIFDTEKLSKALKVTATDLTNFPTISLKANLLLSLTAHYNNYIADSDLDHKTNVAQWMISNCKGLFCIESNLLLLSAHFTIYKKELNSTLEEIYFKCNTSFTYDALMALENTLKEDPSAIKNLSFNKDEHPETIVTNGKFKNIEGTTYQLLVVANWGNTYTTAMDASALKNDVLFVLPNFIKSIHTSDFKQRFNYLLDNELPIHTTYNSVFVDESTLSLLVKFYSTWHNSIIYNAKQSEQQLENYMSYNPKLDNTTWYSNMVNTVEAETTYNKVSVEKAGQLYELIKGLNQNITND